MMPNLGDFFLSILLLLLLLLYGWFLLLLRGSSGCVMRMRGPASPWCGRVFFGFYSSGVSCVGFLSPENK